MYRTIKYFFHWPEYCILLVTPHPTVTLFLILATKCQTDLKEEENEEFVRLYKKGKGEGAVAEDAYKTIPKFYFKVVIQNGFIVLHHAKGIK